MEGILSTYASHLYLVCAAKKLLLSVQVPISLQYKKFSSQQPFIRFFPSCLNCMRPKIGTYVNPEAFYLTLRLTPSFAFYFLSQLQRTKICQSRESILKEPSYQLRVMLLHHELTQLLQERYHIVHCVMFWCKNI